ncbi:MAG TPA: orotidine-5'-phosphate decarboxylase [Armatimonadetes bacterium]|nr:orotidine-5'-phosphate decarboxylase [Armatimonadota bacterium]
MKEKHNPLILALDVPKREEALALVARLREYVGGFKVGLQLVNAAGPGILDDIRERGGRVFYDAKFHDIPHTVSGAVAEAVKHRVWMLNVHTLGGVEMMKAAVESARQTAAACQVARPLLLGVTVLTSIDEETLRLELQVEAPLPAHVAHLARLAQQAGLDGVVASPQEIRLIRAACGEDFLLVTPGVRPTWAAKQDQKRVLTPAEALQEGADYLVIGRPLTQAPDPVAAAQRLLQECGQKLKGTAHATASGTGN